MYEIPVSLKLNSDTEKSIYIYTSALHLAPGVINSVPNTLPSPCPDQWSPCFSDLPTPTTECQAETFNPRSMRLPSICWTMLQNIIKIPAKHHYLSYEQRYVVPTGSSTLHWCALMEPTHFLQWILQSHQVITKIYEMISVCFFRSYSGLKDYRNAFELNNLNSQWLETWPR